MTVHQPSVSNDPILGSVPAAHSQIEPFNLAICPSEQSSVDVASAFTVGIDPTEVKYLSSRLVSKVVPSERVIVKTPVELAKLAPVIFVSQLEVGAQAKLPAESTDKTVLSTPAKFTQFVPSNLNRSSVEVPDKLTSVKLLSLSVPTPPSSFAQPQPEAFVHLATCPSEQSKVDVASEFTARIDSSPLFKYPSAEWSPQLKASSHFVELALTISEAESQLEELFVIVSKLFSPVLTNIPLLPNNSASNSSPETVSSTPSPAPASLSQSIPVPS